MGDRPKYRCVAFLNPNAKKLVLYIPVHFYCGKRSLLRWNQVQILWCMMFLTCYVVVYRIKMPGIHFQIRIMNKWSNSNRTIIEQQLMMKQLNKRNWMVQNWIIEEQNKWIIVAEWNNIQYCRCTQYKITRNHPTNEAPGKLKGRNCMKPKDCWTESTQIRWFSRQPGREAGLRERWPKATQGGHQTWVYSDQMVFVMARQGGWTGWAEAKDTRN
jgi:hypothetical protein